MAATDPDRHDRYDFAGRRVLVTGGAAGIGAALARLLAHRGATLVLADRRHLVRPLHCSISSVW